MTSRTLRTFIALELDDPAKDSITSFVSYLRSGKIALSGLKIPERENTHLTLFFLGDFFDKDTIERFSEDFRKIEFLKIPFKFRSVGFFPNQMTPRVIWISPDEDASRKIMDLRNVVGGILKTYGFNDEEREFIPHITLARVREPQIYRRYADYLSSFSIDGSYCFESLSLFNSVLTPKGPIYEKISEVKLE